MRARHSYFFALQPDAVATAQVDRLIGDLVLRRLDLGRPILPCRLHVSLNGLLSDDAPNAGVVAAAARAMSRVARRPFVVAFNRLAMFGKGAGDRAAVLRGDEGVLGVDLLRGEIHAALADAGLTPRRERPFEAHLTLARGVCAAREFAIAPVAWTVREFVLIHSFVGETRYEVAGRFPLAG